MLGNLLEDPTVQEGAVVAVTSFTKTLLIVLICFFASLSIHAAVLDEDRADVLYHSYDGGGMKIDGPAILLRKKTSETVALSA